MTPKKIRTPSIGPGSETLLPNSDKHAFCPQGGLQGSASWHFNEELRCLLGRRLRVAALILCGGFAMFLLRDLLLRETGPKPAIVLVPHVIVTVVLGVLTALLYARSCMSLRILRTCEVLVFGLPALFFVWFQYIGICKCTSDEVIKVAANYPAFVSIPWIILIHTYGLFIPNTCKRAMGVIAVMVLLALGAVVTAGAHEPALEAVLYGNAALLDMAIWLGIASVTAVWGIHRFGDLRRKAFDAQRIGEYTLREKLGAGGMGEVFLAEHRFLKRDCAIKLIRDDATDDSNAIARFESEVQATARMTHPNTIEIYDYGHTDDGTFYYAMEYLPGMNLQEMVEQFGPLPPERVIHLLRQVCGALREAHAAGLVHRDIKPGNIFSAERGGIYDMAKLLDFGLVKSLRPQDRSLKLTIDGALVGSPLYAAPEMTLDGKSDARSDIYSLGATAFYLLTGRAVFPGENALKVIFAHVKEEPTKLATINPDIPAALDAIVQKCLEKKPEDRFTDVRSLEEALADCGSSGLWSQDRAIDWWLGNQPIRKVVDSERLRDEADATQTAQIRV
jgi:serine/threonine-protein kinase